MLNRKHTPKLVIILGLILVGALFVYKEHRHRSAPVCSALDLSKRESVLTGISERDIEPFLNDKFPLGTKRDVIESALGKACDSPRKPQKIIRASYKIPTGPNDLCGYHIIFGFDDTGTLVEPIRMWELPCEMT